MTSPVIHITDLVKTFGTTRALDGFNLAIEPGQVAGFLGPNGAGKSTTIRVLLGLIKADSGHVEVLGQDPWADAVELHQRLAYVPGDVNLWPNLSGGECIDLFTRLRGSSSSARRRSELIERFELDPTKKARSYSKGNRQKVALVAAFATDAELYLLDEPTSGLDPLMEQVFRSEVRRLREAGKTVLLSSHIMGEVEALCDTVSIIRSGQNVESGRLSELRHLTSSTVDVVTRNGVDTLASLDVVHDVVVEGDRVRFSVENGALPRVLSVLNECDVETLTITEPSLEELFLRHYETEARG